MFPAENAAVTIYDAEHSTHSRHEGVGPGGRHNQFGVSRLRNSGRGLYKRSLCSQSQRKALCTPKQRGSILEGKSGFGSASRVTAAVLADAQTNFRSNGQRFAQERTAECQTAVDVPVAFRLPSVGKQRN